MILAGTTWASNRPSRLSHLFVMKIMTLSVKNCPNSRFAIRLPR
jgi:hypothetical protein